jgi:hypothetical protein
VNNPKSTDSNQGTSAPAHTNIFVEPQQHDEDEHGQVHSCRAPVCADRLLECHNKYTATYLINNEGRLVHQWTRSTHSPGNSVYLLPSGNLLRSCKTQGYFGTGEGGRVEEYDWNDSLVWQFDYSTPNSISHHDIKPLPNGNILLLAIEKPQRGTGSRV